MCACAMLAAADCGACFFYYDRQPWPKVGLHFVCTVLEICQHLAEVPSLTVITQSLFKGVPMTPCPNVIK